MAKRRVMLTYTPETSTEPIIYNLGKQFNLITNIHQADTSNHRGWIIVELDGEDSDIEAGIAWVISRGVRVDTVSDELAEA